MANVRISRCPKCKGHGVTVPIPGQWSMPCVMCDGLGLIRIERQTVKRCSG
jgi:DnaJ-class molecular chaperone